MSLGIGILVGKKKKNKKKKTKLELGDLNKSPLDLRFVIQVISSRIYSLIDYEG